MSTFVLGHFLRFQRLSRITHRVRQNQLVCIGLEVLDAHVRITPHHRLALPTAEFLKDPGRNIRLPQLAREAGAYVIGTGRAADRQKVLDLGAQGFIDLDHEVLEDVGSVDLVFDVIGGDIGKRSAGLVRAGGTFVTIVGPPEARPAQGLAIDFVVESDRVQLTEIVEHVRDGRLRTNIGNVSSLDDAVAAFNPTERVSGKTVIRVRD